MIKVDNYDIWGFGPAIRGMRNPMNSWSRSDSEIYPGNEASNKIGKNDLDLMCKLYNAGSEHRKYLRQIMVSMDITAPLYWWKEMDTYKVGTTSNSCSTMHKIHAKEFTLNDFSTDHLTEYSVEQLESLIDWLNMCRVNYNLDKEKEYWWQMIQLLPSSYNQKRTITMSYENVMNIIRQRDNHKLDEWREFVKTLKKLPYIEDIRGGI